MLEEGDQVSLDCDNPEAAVFVCNFGKWSWMGSRLDDGDGVPTTLTAGGQLHVQALYDYEPAHSGELGFRTGDFIQVVQRGEPDGWWEGSLNGQRGFFPSTYCAVEPQR